MPIAGSGQEKDWKDGANPVEGPPATPITAAALEDIETRLAAYTDQVAVLKSAYGTKGQIPVATGVGTGDVLPAPGTGDRLVGDASATRGWRIRVKDEVINVRDAPYNAAGDALTDDRAAIQAAINAAEAAGKQGGTVYFPPGFYGINTTTAGLSIPNEKPIKLQGAGNTIHYPAGSIGGVIPESTTIIVRNGGTNPLISNPDSGTVGTRCRASIHDICFRNGSTNARLAYFRRINHMKFHGVRFEGNNSTTPYTLTVPSTEFQGVWNSNFYNCFWYSLGSGATYPACLFSISDGNLAGTSSVTAHLTDCEFEKNHGTDFKSAGHISHENLGINMVNAKMEGQQSTTRTWPCIELENTNQSTFAACALYTGGPAPNVINTGTDAVLNSFTGTHFYNNGSGTGNRPLIQQNAGRLLVAGCTFFNFPATVNTSWAIASTVPQLGALSGGNMYWDNAQTSTSSGKRHTDARTGTSGYGLSPVRGSNLYAATSYPCGPELMY